MPEISRFYGVVFRMYFADHNPPHFHAIYGGQEARIDIRSLAAFTGRLPPRALGLVIEWPQAHRCHPPGPHREGYGALLECVAGDTGPVRTEHGTSRCGALDTRAASGAGLEPA